MTLPYSWVGLTIIFLHEVDEKECVTFAYLYHMEHILFTSQLLGIKMSTTQFRMFYSIIDFIVGL